MYTQSPLKKYKKWYSIAEYSVLVIVIWVLCAAVIPIFIRINAYKRNAVRMTDIKNISQQVIWFHTKNWWYPMNLKELAESKIWIVPKDPNNRVYCSGTPWYTSGDYQYYTCKDCEAIWPLKTYGMNNIVQIWALMEWENGRWERNSWNRWSPYKLWEKTNCAANAVRWAWTLIEWVKWNRIGGTWNDTRSFVTNIVQKDYDPRYNQIIASERK